MKYRIEKKREVVFKVQQKPFSSNFENNSTEQEMEIEFVLQKIYKLFNCLPSCDTASPGKRELVVNVSSR